MRIQYISNLFVDRSVESIRRLWPKPSAPYLALLGNTGDPSNEKTRQFLRAVQSQWDCIFWVPGPREFQSVYRKESVDAKMDQLLECSMACGTRIIPMMQTSVQIGNVYVYGSTFWNSSKHFDTIGLYKGIYSRKGSRSLQEFMKEGRDDIEWMQDSLRKDPGVPKLILSYTHPWNLKKMPIEYKNDASRSIVFDSSAGVKGWLSGAGNYIYKGMYTGIEREEPFFIGANGKGSGNGSIASFEPMK